MLQSLPRNLLNGYLWTHKQLDISPLWIPTIATIVFLKKLGKEGIQNALLSTDLLKIAVRRRNIQLARLALRFWGNPNAIYWYDTDCNGDPPSLLHDLAEDPSEEAIELLKLLFLRGARVSIIKPRSKDTPLMIAASEGNHLAIRLLIEKDADPNQQNKNGETALHFAYKNFRPLSAIALVKKGANHKARNNNGKTPWDSISEKKAASVFYDEISRRFSKVKTC